MNGSSRQNSVYPGFLDKKQQQEQAAADQTGKISAYLDLADKALEAEQDADSALEAERDLDSQEVA